MRVLPQPRLKGEMSVEEALAARRSVRAFAGDVLSPAQIGQLLWAAQGITESARGLHPTPSAGATFPLESYVVTPGGVFHYVPAEHILADVHAGDVRGELCTAALAQPWVRSAPAILVLAAVMGRTTRRYGDRGEMYVHMEAGHAAQNIHLQAAALGLVSVPVAAFDDAAVSKALSLPADQIPLYLIAVGLESGSPNATS